jgi:tetratricopeptide (TPR) repeat protein
MRSALQIVVFVRTVDNRPAPNGVSVRLDADDGGLIDVRSSDSSGKVTFRPPAPARYTITVRQPGYKDAVQHVDLTLTPTAAVTLQLVPLPNAEAQSFVVAEPGEPGAATVSAAELAVPEGARREFEAGEKLLTKKHDVGRSIGHFKKAIQLYEGFPQAYTFLGLAYLQDQKWQDSKSALERAIQLDPKSGPAYVALGGCLNQLKDYPGAEKALVKGLEMNPESPEGNYELAKTYWSMRRWREAEPYAVKAEKLEPDVPGVHVVMGDILLQKPDAAGALKEFNEYLRLDPHGPMSEPVQAMVAKLKKAVGNSK